VTVVGKPLRKLTAIALLLAAPVLAGCGGEGHASSEKLTQHPKGGYLSAADLERQLGNAFRKGLYRLAVMTQRSEDAKDLGQPLPTGLVDRVSCSSGAPQPSGARAWAWSCGVTWKSVEGHREQTKYAVRLSPGECFAAGATPARTKLYDATIRTYSEDPLNVLGSLRPGC
jgi:hypothetical protein